MSLVHDTTNDTRADDFKSVVHELGRAAAAGKDSLPNLAIAFARAVQDGAIDIKKDAAGRDGSARVFEWYATSEGKKKIHDRSEGSVKAQVAKLRQIQHAASNPKFDFTTTINQAHTIRQTAIDDGIDVKPAYAAFVDLAREQLKLDDDMDDAMIFATVTKTESTREVTLEGQLKKAQKIIEDVIAGEKHPGVQDQSPEILQVGELLNQRLAALMTSAKTVKALNDALEAGIISVEMYEERMALAA